MANVIDIVLKARDQATASIKQVETSVQRLGTTSSGVSQQLTQQSIAWAALGAAAVAAATAGVRALQQFGESAEQLQRLSNRLGVSTTDLQVFSKIIKDAGGDPAELTTALTFLNRAIATNDPLLERLGITTKDTTEAFRQLVGILSQSQDITAKTEIAFQLLGRGSSDLIADFDRLARSFDETKTRTIASGENMSTSLVAAGVKIDDEFDELGANWKIIWNNMATAAAGPTAKILGFLNQLFEQKRKLDAERAAFGQPNAATEKFQFGGSRGEEVGGPGGGGIKPVDLAAALRPKGGLPENAIALEQLQGIRDLLPQLPREIGRSQIAIDKLTDSVQLFANSLPVAVVQFQEAMAQITDAGTVFSDTLTGIFNGLEFSIADVFRGIVLEGRIQMNSLVNVVRSAVDAILQEIARIAAAKLATAIVGVAASIIGGIFGLGGPIAIGTGIGGGIGRGAFPDSALAGAGGNVTNVNINAIDARSVADQFSSPFGAFRVAGRRAARLGV